MEKYIKYLCGLCLLCVLCASCQDGDWDAPDFSDGVPYGNNELTETNVITIAQLKAQYPNYAANYTTTEITADAKLRVRVTGNDVQGNLYNAIAVQEDESGDALIVAISGNDLFAFMPVGQELLIDLKGLYIGGYGAQPQLGTPYTNASGSTYVSRMSNTIWQNHVKLIGKADPKKVAPIEFTSARDLEKDCGKLMTIKNVSIAGADGTVTWASKNDPTVRSNSVSKYFAESPYSTQSKYMVYTSTYSDFANTPIPTGKMNLTGIWKRYNNAWELVIRSVEDIEVVKD
ncbi:MAG: hypothetical protein IJ762_10485 [Bacteroidaceae bacterium]|nr:hypothetical protein [Bacteroidaceae bacterium]MBR1789593.1 hypothetical protein [Bacteroidaceae bacterium]